MKYYVIHTPTQKECDTLIAYFKERGYRWAGHQNLEEYSAFLYNGRECCIKVNEYPKTLQHSPDHYYKEEGCTILTLEEFYTSQGLLLPQHLIPTPVIASWPW